MFDINWWNLELTSRNFATIQEAYNARNLSYGPYGQKFERQLANILNIKHVMLTTSGSTALLVALKALGISNGDEVIVPNRTFQATANAAEFLGAKIVLVDVNSADGLIDTSKIEEAITPKTKAIIVVHLNGKSVNMAEVLRIRERYGIKIIEDTAQAFYSKNHNQYLGTIGDIGCFSMGVTKFMTTGQGGFVVTNIDELSEKMRRNLFHAQTGIDDKKFNEPGFNFRMPDLLSSLALSQIEELDAKKSKFLSIYNQYESDINKMTHIKLLSCKIDKGEVPIWVEVLSNKRDQLFSYLKEKKIETLKFYPSLHRAPYLSSQNGRDYSNSLIFEEQGLILPCGPDISSDKVIKVINALREFDNFDF